ncbi:MAG: VOC family protein [Synergistaceae bacterium]|jgi:lactoylglutathione lyase|nr:VOC family protein [Synergistaceae bacterium]
MKSRILHTNINVLDVDRSLAFYEKALGLHEKRRKAREGYVLSFISDDTEAYEIELTCLGDRKEPYDLGDNETHIAFAVEDFEASHKLHEEMGCVCYENLKLRVYFIEDPDGYWLEIIPEKR